VNYPIFHKVVIEDNVAKAIMQWVTHKQFLDQEFVTLFKFNIDELKLRAGYAESLSENINEYRKAIGIVMSVERSLEK
tara:strand:- start:1035 stop:1268 length:234 start_codon:yes stop_codon:yes gene_type:complete